MSALTVDVPGNEWITSNDRRHWAAKAKRTAAIRRRVATLARAQHIPHHEGRVHVTATIHGRVNNRMDPANAYPTIKAAIDGCTDAGLWDDDDSTHLIGPDMRRGDPIPALPAGWHRITITIEQEEGNGGINARMRTAPAGAGNTEPGPNRTT